MQAFSQCFKANTYLVSVNSYQYRYSQVEVRGHRLGANRLSTQDFLWPEHCQAGRQHAAAVFEVRRIVLREVMVICEAEVGPALTDGQNSSGSEGDSSDLVKSRLDIMDILTKGPTGPINLKTQTILRFVTTTNDKSLSPSIYPVEAKSLALGVRRRH